MRSSPRTSRDELIALLRKAEIAIADLTGRNAALIATQEHKDRVHEHRLAHLSTVSALTETPSLKELFAHLEATACLIRVALTDGVSSDQIREAATNAAATATALSQANSNRYSAEYLRNLRSETLPEPTTE